MGQRDLKRVGNNNMVHFKTNSVHNLNIPLRNHAVSFLIFSWINYITYMGQKCGNNVT